MNEELLKKWLNDELINSELEQFKSSEDFDLHQQILDEAQNFKASNFSEVKSFEDFKAEYSEKDNSETTTEKPVIKLNSYKKLYRIAAMLVVSLGLYFTFFNNNATTVKTLASQKTNVELPDGSSVTVNAKSQIAFNKKKWSKNREVKLNGEAFFKVAKGKKFDVVTTEGTVSVLGTEFTVNQRKNYFEVKCFEGIVAVKHGSETHKLTQGKTYRFFNNKSELGKTIENSPEWLHNISRFNSVPLSEVLSELERQYNITIVADNVNVDKMFTGGFVHNNLEQALITIVTPLKLSYQKDTKNNKITLSPINQPEE